MVCCFGAMAVAQDYSVDTKPARGFMPNKDQLSGPIDTIEVSGGKLHLEIPLPSMPPGPGGAGFDLNLLYESRLYNTDPVKKTFYAPSIPPYQNIPDAPGNLVWLDDLTGGWTYNFQNYRLDDETKSVVPPARIVKDGIERDCYLEESLVYRSRIALPDGSMHILHLRGAESYENGGDGFIGIHPDGQPASACAAIQPAWQNWTGLLTFYTVDGSYLKLETTVGVPGWTLYYPDGRRVVKNDTGTWIYDPNGNWIHVSYVLDDPVYGICYRIENSSEGWIVLKPNFEETDRERRDLIVARGPNRNVEWYVDWSLKHIGGSVDNPRWYAVYPTLPEWFDPNDPEDLKEISATILVDYYAVDYVHLPSLDGSRPPLLGEGEPAVSKSYKFEYTDDQDDGYGEVDAIRTPSGAVYRYAYAGQGWGTLNLAELPLGVDIVNRRAITKKEIYYTGGSEPDLQWIYDRDGVPSSGRIAITNPDKGVTSHYPCPTGNGFGLICRIEVAAVNGKILTVQKREWGQNKAYGTRYASGQPQNQFLKKEMSTIYTAAGAPSKTATKEQAYDKNGNLRSSTEYDWVAYPGETGATVKRKTTFDTYLKYLGSDVRSADDLSDLDDINAYWRPHNTALWPLGTARRLNAIMRRTVLDGSGTAFAATEYIYDNALGSGNVTYENRWDDLKAGVLPGDLGSLTSENSLQLRREYDTYGNGNLVRIYEPNVPTQITYNTKRNLVERVDYGPNAERSYQYTWLNGVAVGSKTDLKNGLTTSYSYDDVSRQTSVIEADTRKSETFYFEDTRKITTKADLREFGVGLLQTITSYDRLGRVLLVQKSDGSPILNADGSPINETIGIKTMTMDTYPAGGRRVIASTPHRSTSDASMQWTCTQYDEAGRVTAVAMFKGSAAPSSCEQASNRTGITRTEYNAEWTIITDPAGKKRANRNDALGRLVEVKEDPDGLNYSTIYTYDPLDNLTTVTQGTQKPRTFDYSSLGRLLSADNPESGTISYTYHDSGDLYRRTDALGKVTTLNYDGLHRIWTKTYSDSTPPVTYEYHSTGTPDLPNAGRLKSVSSSAGVTQYERYNVLGQVISSSQTISGFAGRSDFSYSYWLSGSLKSVTYPSGRVVNYDIDDAGRTNKAYIAGKPYADLTESAGITYPFTADGRIAQMKLGNGRYVTRDYRTPGTTTTYRLGTSLGAGDLIQLEYNFDGTNNNGNLISQDMIRSGYNWQQTFAYDSLNRLLMATEAGGWSQTYGYDRYGNKWLASSSGIAEDSHEPATQGEINAANNRLIRTGVSYDLAGNQTTYGEYTLEYDAEGRNTKVKIGATEVGTYSYDGEGRRVKKVWTSGPASTTYYVYNALGQLAVEYSSLMGNTDTTYPFTDMLGSVRGVTSQAGSMVECYDYLPFGRMLKASDNNRDSCFPPTADVGYSTRLPQKFTGKERDAETGLDYFLARYYSGAQGRFLSVDPENAGGAIKDPQSWNAYAYSRNNPIKYVDPDGMMYMICEVSSNRCRSDISDEAFDALIWNALTHVNQLDLSSNNAIVGTTQNGTYILGGQLYTYRHLYEDAAVRYDGFQTAVTIQGGIAGLKLAAGAAKIAAKTIAKSLSGETVVIGKMSDLARKGAIGSGERKLADELPDLGNPKANWVQNASKLRKEMAEGEPIRDASAGNPASNTGFLKAERNLLQNHNWTLKNGYWYPPAKK